MRHAFNLTEVANALFTSQSGVSKHIKDLENELGVELFVRRGKRLLGLTEPGSELVGIVERILLDTKNIKRLGEQFANRDQGQLVIATTHTQARYVLPSVVAAFKKEFPKVHLVLHQASPVEIASMLSSGGADVGIATERLGVTPDIASFPYHVWHHGVVVPAGHPLENIKRLTLADLAAYPIITYHEGFTGRPKINAAFAREDLEPDVVMSALDADVIKTYVELGLGIGIIASLAYQLERDIRLRLLDASHLFEANTSLIAVRRGAYLRGFAYRFISLCSAALTEGVLREAMKSDLPDDG